MTYPATRYLRRLTAADGWQGRLVTDEHGDPLVIVTVRVGPTWTDSVAIEGEHRAVAMRHRTNASDLIVPPEPPGGSGAVWHRDGRCDEVLAELLDELPPGSRPGAHRVLNVGRSVGGMATSLALSGPAPSPAGHRSSRLPPLLARLPVAHRFHQSTAARSALVSRTTASTPTCGKGAGAVA